MRNRLHFWATCLALVAAIGLATTSSFAKKDELKFPIATVQDPGVPENPTGATKARELARLVIERGRARSLAYDPNSTAGSSDYQGVQSVVVIDGWRWTVWIANKDEADEIRIPDMISFWARPEGSRGQDSLLTFSDRGLDGNCDSGIVPRGLSETGQELRFWAEYKEGLEHRAAFQQRYDQAVDALIAYYKQDK